MDVMAIIANSMVIGGLALLLPKKLLIPSVLLIATNCLFAQANGTTPVSACRELEGKISELLEITRVVRQPTQGNDCDLEFHGPTGTFLLEINRYESEAKSSKRFSVWFDATVAEDRYQNGHAGKIKQMDRRDFWDDARAYQSSSTFLVMFWHKTVNLMLTSSGLRSAAIVERAFRGINFRRWVE